ncbi:MAG: sensor histidine kinase [Acidobacteriota bacterium]
MKKGQGSVPTFNAHSDIIIRSSGFLLPVILFGYGILLQTDIIHSDHLFVAPVFYATCTAWLLLGIYQLLVPVTSRTGVALRLLAYHVLAALYVWFAAGFATPFIATWIVLFYASYLYLGRTGLNLSIFGLFAVALGDVLLNIDNTLRLLEIGLFFLGTLLVGYITGMLSANQDIDREELSRSRAEEALQRDRILTIVNNLADAIFSTDKDGVIQVYNAACLNLLDTNSELKGKNIDDVISLTDIEHKRFRLVRHFRTARSVESREDLSTVISGETIRLSVIYSAVRNANSHQPTSDDGYVVILRDITKQKSLEEERDEFISVVSHELRTPITIAEGSLSNVQLMMGRNDIPKTTLAENVKTSHDQVLFLAKMVNDLSTLSRAERGVADATEEIDVAVMVHDLYNEYAPQAEAKGLHFNLDASPQLGTVVASHLYLKELLQNFITNAIKYTKKGEVTLIVKKTADSLEFAVKDTGIGISKSDQAHVFDKFWRSEDYRTRETGGTGLGLYVTRKLAKKLGVEIELTSRLNHGSTFSFVIKTLDK